MNRWAKLGATSVVWLFFWPLLIAILAAGWLGFPLSSWGKTLFK
jgi:hypothetical protein